MAACQYGAVPHTHTHRYTPALERRPIASLSAYQVKESRNSTQRATCLWPGELTSATNTSRRLSEHLSQGR